MSMREPRNSSPVYGILFLRYKFKISNIYKECMTSLALLSPRNFAAFEIQFPLQYYTHKFKHFTSTKFQKFS